MALLYNRDYSLQAIDIDTGEKRTFTGLRIAFDFTNTYRGVPNSGTITIYNTSPEGREILEKNRNAVVLRAGYVGNVEDVLGGAILKSITVKDGAEYTTEIEIGDAVFALAETHLNKVFDKNTKEIEIIDAALNALKEKGVDLNMDFDSSAFQTPIPRAITLSMPAKEVLNTYIGKRDFTWSVQNNELRIFKLDVGNSKNIYKLTPETGLIGSPVKAFNHISFKTLLLPNLKVGDKVLIESPNTNARYAIMSMDGKGDTHGDSWGYNCEGLLAI